MKSRSPILKLLAAAILILVFSVSISGAMGHGDVYICSTTNHIANPINY